MVRTRIDQKSSCYAGCRCRTINRASASNPVCTMSVNILPFVGMHAATPSPQATEAAIPSPVIDLDAVPDPISEIIDSPEFEGCVEFLGNLESAQRALMSPNSQALLYCTIRNLRPANVVEIGTYRASTTEAICRALHANGYGVIHTVDPFGGEVVPALLASWPPELQERVRFYPVNSMDFFGDAARKNYEFELVFVDGNHDYEFALFDICCAARMSKPNGFIFVDNVSQPGPFTAKRDFLKLHPGWREMGAHLVNYRPEYPFDRERRAFVNTDFCVLRAPSRVFVGLEPYTPGERVWENMEINGLHAHVARPATGTLNLQLVLRAFGSPPTEVTVERQLKLEGVSGEIKIPVEASYGPEAADVPRRIEPWLTWTGEEPLELTASPLPY